MFIGATLHFHKPIPACEYSSINKGFVLDTAPRYKESVYHVIPRNCLS